MASVIVGVSGLERAVAFKQAHWPSLDARESRISQGHDAAAAIVVDGVLVAAAAQERFDRRKHSAAFPIDAVRFCLRQADVAPEQITEVAHGFDYGPYRKIFEVDPTSAELFRDVYSRDALVLQLRRDLPEVPPDRVHSVGHHLAHAASAAFTSGWDECLVVVNDAMGEAQSLTAFRLSGGRLEPIGTIGANDSIGILYSLVTLHLGFEFNSDEYKIMGLAPYGDPSRYRAFFEQAVELRPDGTCRIQCLRLNRTREEREAYLATRRYLDSHLIARRLPEAELTEAHRDVAAALQACLERVLLHVCGYHGRQTGLRRIALAGGVALNCTANGALTRSGLFDEVYVQPAAGDDGVALGAALYRASRQHAVPNRRMPAPLLGPAYCAGHVDAALSVFHEQIDVQRFDSLDATCADAARRIADGAVIAWHRGRMEYGPRALGNRSILADPGHPQMRDRINAMVKKRESFRPFAPACTVEQAHEYFDVAPGTALPYMVSVVDVRPDYRDRLPAITHVNGSARLQTVSAADNPDFHALLRAVGGATGREMLLNTSFNVKSQPIVNTPEEAIETFLGTGIDWLFLENVRVGRRCVVKAPVLESLEASLCAAS